MANSADNDISVIPFTTQLRSLALPYWLSNTMEMLERLAYYGLRTVLPVYMLLAVESGGPQFDNVQKGQILAAWAAIQSFVPILSGGFADRYGYRLAVAASILIKMAGYIGMAFAMEAAFVVSLGASAGVPGHPTVFWLFGAGAMLLALGTAIFKPGIQALMADGITPQNSSVAWGLFYQCVNLGGFLGPILAGYMKLMAWKWVFLSCAGIVALNFLILPFIPEPKREGPVSKESVWWLIYRSATEILEPRVLGFLAVFSGFWAMFYQLFDLLPVFIEDWVDTTGVYNLLAVPLFSWFGSVPPTEWGGHVPQELMVNLNAGLIMLFAFVVGYFTGKIRSMNAMIWGIVVAALGIFLLRTHDGWMLLLGIAVFSFGEMMASPTKTRYIVAIAPPGKKGLYLGYVNATVGIGWSLGCLIAGTLYEVGGDKVALARRYLVDTHHMERAVVDAIPKTEVLTTLASKIGAGIPEVTSLLWSTYQPTTIWVYFAAIGLISMIGLWAFDRVTRLDLRLEGLALTGVTFAVTALSYGWNVGVHFAALMLLGVVLHGQRPAPQVET